MLDDKERKKLDAIEKLATNFALAQDALISLLEKKGILGREEIREAVQNLDTKKSEREKRQQRRFTRRCEVEFTRDGSTRRGISSDFSLTGLFIRTNHPLVEGTVFDLLVHLPDGKMSRLRGKAVRSLKTPLGSAAGAPVKNIKNGMGVQLLEKDDSYLHFIKSLLG
jgi:hypothetical protein